MPLKLAALLLALFMAGATPGRAQNVPGVTDTEITVGLTTPLSGPAAVYGNTAVAMEAWAKHVNAQGGIHGRKLRVEIKDDGYNPGRAIANLQEMPGKVFMNVGLLGSAIINAAKDFPAEYKFPIVSPYGNPAIWAKQPRDRLRYVFVDYPDYVDEGEFLVTHATNALGSKKVAVFYQNDDYGKGGLEGVRRGVKALGAKVAIATELPYEVTDRELGTQALKMKDSGADTVILYSTTTHGANLVKEMAKVGYRPRLMASFPLGDHLIMFRLLGPLWEGAHYNVLGALAGEPDADKILDVLTRIEPKLKGRENTALAGAASMMVAIEGLKNAGRNLTRETFVEGMENIKDYTVERLSPPITFGPNRRHGRNAVRMMKAESAEKNQVSPVTGYQMFPPHF